MPRWQKRNSVIAILQDSCPHSAGCWEIATHMHQEASKPCTTLAKAQLGHCTPAWRFQGPDLPPEAQGWYKTGSCGVLLLYCGVSHLRSPGRPKVPSRLGSPGHPQGSSQPDFYGSGSISARCNRKSPNSLKINSFFCPFRLRSGAVGFGPCSVNGRSGRGLPPKSEIIGRMRGTGVLGNSELYALRYIKTLCHAGKHATRSLHTCMAPALMRHTGKHVTWSVQSCTISGCWEIACRVHQEASKP